MSLRPIHTRLYVVILTFFVATSFSRTANYTECLIDWQNNHNGSLDGLVNNNGLQVTDFGDARGFTFEACKKDCGSGQEAFNWSDFSQQFSSWLLPWLALVSQLPFGAESRLDNLISVILTVGSPTLAAYSLAITVLNSRWAFRKFSMIKYPNQKEAAQVLTSLQQISLQITTEDVALLPSLIVLSENDPWWKEMMERLEYTYTWSISTATSVAWVIIAFVFTVIDSFTSVGNNLHTNGQSVGSLWLWLLPLVVGWLWYPVSSRSRLVTALHYANQIAYAASPKPDDLTTTGDGKPVYEPVLARTLSDARAISVLDRREAVYRDQGKSAPIFNYSRFWGWVYVVDQVAEAFENASEHVKQHKSVDGDPWTLEDKWVDIHPANRTGSLEQVRDYCEGDYAQGKRRNWGSPGALKRIAMASLLALGLQWGTTLSSVMVVLYTPTKGLGCRSGAYILYGTLSTVIWMMLLASSSLSHYCSIHSSPHPRSSTFTSVSIAAWTSVFLRRVAVLFAFMNSIWIVTTCIFQFASVFDNCYCNSSVLGWGANKAYNVFIVTSDEIPGVFRAWAGGFVLAGGVVVLFLLFVSFVIESPTEDKR